MFKPRRECTESAVVAHRIQVFELLNGQPESSAPAIPTLWSEVTMSGELLSLPINSDDQKCLACGKDALDTGWECTECGYDCMPWYYPQGVAKPAD